ncbi:MULTISPECIES: hypothetical protein [unclassified Nostoc]|uniref:hypothetical protein n=1 Tax=unclassified Nostoc TaxID=2593658 RepID=UPI002AD4DE92|nr:hypothetical protein [Nostoc sp. DedQUE03]MDZ7975657.1 hypothetical protein [Nostoc sp. DedQUE03]MDZ8047412.1 hypothetical protein [Nostoc sp. DedQUE02]
MVSDAGGNPFRERSQLLAYSSTSSTPNATWSLPIFAVSKLNEFFPKGNKTHQQPQPADTLKLSA